MMVRIASESDSDGVTALLALMRRKLNDDLFHQMLSDSSRAVFVAESDGVLAGMILCNLVIKLDRIESRIDRLVVDEAFRGKGIGTELLLAAEGWSWEHGAKRIEFTSSADRPEAHHLYTKNGYEIRDTKVFAKQHGVIEEI